MTGIAVDIRRIKAPGKIFNFAKNPDGDFKLLNFTVHPTAPGMYYGVTVYGFCAGVDQVQ
jgi:hypothetical protein